MRRKNRGGDDGGGAGEWLNTYADMVTLLLTFFAVLLSMSTVNQEKFNAFIKSFSNLPPEKIEEIIAGENPEEIEDAEAPTPQEVSEAMDELYKMLQEYIKQNGMEDTITLNKLEDAIYIRFESSVFFEPDKSVMLPGGYDTLSFIGDGLKQYENMIARIAIMGHTASVGDIPDYPVSDWDLSSLRASVVVKYFDEEKNIDSKKMRLLAYGKNQPIADNSTEEGRKKNRRVELAVIGIGTDVYDPYEELGDLFSITEGGDSSGGSETTEPTTSETDSQGETSDDGIQKDVSPYD